VGNVTGEGSTNKAQTTTQLVDYQKLRMAYSTLERGNLKGRCKTALGGWDEGKSPYPPKELSESTVQSNT